MTVTVFGKGDRIAFPKPGPTVIGETTYTHPTLDCFYSESGFAFPLDYENVLYQDLIDGVTPQQTTGMRIFSSGYDYLLIQPNGRLWRVMIHDKEGEMALSNSVIHSHGQGWWLVSSITKSLSLGTDDSMLLGFLTANPTEDQVDQYFLENRSAQELVWLSVPDIVAKIKTDFLDNPDPILQELKDAANTEKGPDECPEPSKSPSES